jgi:hypothetical protein
MPLFPPPVVFSPLPVDRTPAHVSQMPYQDVQWNRPVFRPPSLPTPSQIWSDIPFTAHFNAKDRGQK